MVATVIRGFESSTNAITELLRVRIVKGEKIGKRDLFGVVSPYCVVRLEKGDGELIDEVVLDKKKKTRNPLWNSILTFRVTRQCCLKVLVFDENKIRRDALLGVVEFDLSVDNVPTETKPPGIYPLKGGRHRNVGNIWIAMHFLPVDASPSDSTSEMQASSSMPEGWEEREDGNGRTFYVNHMLRTTHWDRPTQANERERESEIETRRRRDNYEHRSRVTNSSPDAVRIQIDAIVVASGEDVVINCTAQKWSARLASDAESLEGVPRLGRPSIIENDGLQVAVGTNPK